MYEDTHERSQLRKSMRGLYVPSPDTSAQLENAILDSDLDIDTIYELCEFREKYPTECMGISNRMRFRRKKRNGVGHKCVHKYQVDEKMQPIARLANTQGESLCEICGGISKYLNEHTIAEILQRDPHMGGKETPIVVLQLP